MLLSLPTLVLSFSVSGSLAQVLISNLLPACGQQCAILLQAQAACLPPAAPVTDQKIYSSCFCQSAFLTPLITGGSAEICPACSTAEIGTIENWYQASCAAPNQGPPNQVPPDQEPPAEQPAAPAAPIGGGNSGQGGAIISDKLPPNNNGWMSTHWRWVLMLIILTLGFILLAWLGWFLHRRHHRRRDAEAIGSQPDLRTWGPGQSAHNFGAVDVVPDPMSEKARGLRSGNAGGQARKSGKGSRRLTKGWLRRSGRGD